MKNAVVLALILVLAFALMDFAAEIQQGKADELIMRHFPIDRTIAYQGILKDNSGDPVPNNTYNLTFRIYESSAGGSAIWTSPVIPVVTNGGNFTAILTSVSLPFDTTYYLSVQVQGDSEMSQRQRMTLAPYSATADTANFAFKADTAIVAQNVPDNSITSAKIVNGTIQFADIGQNGAATGQVMKWNGSSWVPRNDSVGVGGGGGWTDNNTRVTLSTNSDSVGIGTSTPAAKLHVNGTLRVNDKANIGPANSNTGSFSSVLGGDMHTADGDFSFIGGGYHNTVRTTYGGVSSGYSNTAGGISPDSFAFIGGGSGNYANANFAMIGGGYQDTAHGVYSAVFSGYDNRAGNTLYDTGAFVGGGVHNEAKDNYSTVSGGRNNTAFSLYATVAGGDSNSADWVCTAGGGRGNYAGTAYSTVAGGINNTADQQWATIGGGGNNTILGSGSTISGGVGNSILAGVCAIPGGSGDTIGSSGGMSMVYGNNVYCNSSFYVVLYDGLDHGQLSINRDGRDGLLTYPITVGTHTGNGNGAYLSNGGVWTNGSSRTFKENFTPFDGDELLKKISNLSITSWNYKRSTEKHVGPVAEEFVGAFDTGVIREADGQRDDQHLAAGDVAGVALAGVQELNKKLERENQELRQMIDNLQNQINDLNGR